MATAKQLRKAMQHAESFDEWRSAALALDELTGAARWRRVDASRHFDYVSIRLRLDHLRRLRAKHDYRGLLSTLNEGIHGNVDGMGGPELYQRSQVGTKHLIEDYVGEIKETLELLQSQTVKGVSKREKDNFFERADHCYGRSALMLSGSGMLAYFHAGVVKALAKEGLLPRILSGTSGGAIIGSIVATHDADELDDRLNPEFLFEAFRSGAGEPGRTRRFGRSVLQVDDVMGMVERVLPDVTFEEALAKTGVHMNVSVAPKETQQTSRLLNATTSPTVLLRSAVLASAALPGFFPPVTLMARDKRGDVHEYQRSRQWVDGAISDDLPMRRLSRLYAVNHYIVSQTNPHIIPFVSSSKRSRSALSTIKVAATRTTREWLNATASVFHGPIKRSRPLNKFTTTALAVLNQDYIGDVNILPPFRISNPTRLMSPLTLKEIQRLVRLGEKSTWPKIEMIRTQTAIGMTLQNIVGQK